eukprot:12118092-Karenia_brevis.AAC.1
MGLSRAFLSKNKCATADGMKSSLKSGEAYSGRKTTLPVGVRCKVPEVAAQVDLAEVLSKLDPVMSKQVLEPGQLLLPVERRPLRLRR